MLIRGDVILWMRQTLISVGNSFEICFVKDVNVCVFFFVCVYVCVGGGGIKFLENETTFVSTEENAISSDKESLDEVYSMFYLEIT